MKKIAIFSHKGGVSKTTTCYHLGWSLAEAGKKVLLVDADSQCNLSMDALGQDNYESYYEKRPENNIHYALKPVFKSMIKPLQPVDCPEIRENLFLLPGHLDFTENEMQLSMAMQLSRDALYSMGNLPGAINYLVEVTAEKFGIDYVLFDMNPSLSAINQDIFVCCDYFMIPCSPDFFSLMAVRSLSRVLPFWEDWARRARDAFNADDVAYPLPFSRPTFLGYTVNDFNLSGGRPQRTFEEFMRQISDEVHNNMIPAFREKGMTLPVERYQRAYDAMRIELSRFHSPSYSNYPSCYCLAQISNFNKLGALSQKQARPVFEVEFESEPSDSQIGTRNWFRDLYPALANRVMELMS